MRKIVFIGSGAIATAIGDVLAEKNKDEIYLLSIEKEVIEMINTMHVNTSYFPKCQLSENLHATDDKNVLLEANVIFLAIPSTAATRRRLLSTSLKVSEAATRLSLIVLNR